jgi:hypothetical protein
MMEEDKMADTPEDPEVETAAETIKGLLYLVAPEKRAAALARALENEEADRKEREKHHGFRVYSAAEMADMNVPGIRYWHDIMRLEARVVYTFARRIRNNHSPAAAARLLFEHHAGAPGSGYLTEYIDDLPRDPPAKAPA